jgi:hypothetical protein
VISPYHRSAGPGKRPRKAAYPGILGVVTALRVLIGVLIAGAIGIALVPLAVLVDLHEGGTGWGLCAEGLDGCRNSYFAGFELFGGVAIALAAVLALIHFCIRLLRWMESRRPETGRTRSTVG